MKYLKLIGAIFIAIVITGCGSSVEGTYSMTLDSVEQFDENSMVGQTIKEMKKDTESMKLKLASGKAVVTKGSTEKTGKYEVDGEKVKITFENLTEIYTMEDDGYLTMTKEHPVVGELIFKLIKES